MVIGRTAPAYPGPAIRPTMSDDIIIIHIIIGREKPNRTSTDKWKKDLNLSISPDETRFDILDIITPVKAENSAITI